MCLSLTLFAHRSAAKQDDPDAQSLPEGGDTTSAPAVGALHEPDALMLKPREVQPTGRVVGILRRAFRPYVCTLDRASLPPSALTSSTSVTVLASPVQRTLPRIRLLTRQAAHLASQKFLVSIDRWSITSRYPEGHFVRVLGQVGSKEGEVESLLEEWEVPYRPFSSAILSCLPEEGETWVVPPKGEADVKGVWRGREDLRDEIVCSIDPPGKFSTWSDFYSPTRWDRCGEARGCPRMLTAFRSAGCQDIDDALHAKRLPNGNIQAGVRELSPAEPYNSPRV